MKTTIIILTFFLFNSCCTLKKCTDHFEPFITVKLKNFTGQEISSAKLNSYDVTTKSLVYSNSTIIFTNTADGDVFSVSSLEYKKEMRDQYFIIQTPVSEDTIYNITYELYSYQTENCNSCFPIKAKKITVTSFRNFSYYYKGQQYFGDTLTIYK